MHQFRVNRKHRWTLAECFQRALNFADLIRVDEGIRETVLKSLAAEMDTGSIKKSNQSRMATGIREQLEIGNCLKV